MRRKWKSASVNNEDCHVLDINDNVRVIRRGQPAFYLYQVAVYLPEYGKWMPLHFENPMSPERMRVMTESKTAIAAAKRYARQLGQETAAVR